MKAVLYLLLVALFSSCAAKKIQYSRKKEGRQLSLEIESLSQNLSDTFSNKKEVIAAVSVDQLAETERPVSKINLSNKKEEKVRKGYDSKEIVVVQSLNKSSDEYPRKFNRDNVFWQIGRTLLKVGLALFTLSGGLLISISSGGGIFLLGGLLIALAVCVLSIPFFLLGLITETMKNRAVPIESPNEI